MHPLQFRAAAGPEDAAALIAVHDACRETDRVREDLCFEYLPRLEHYRKRLADTGPEDWIVVQSGAEVLGYGHLLSSWAEHNGKKVYLHLGWVVPPARGKGIGRELLSRLEARCREKRAQDGTAGARSGRAADPHRKVGDTERTLDLGLLRRAMQYAGNHRSAGSWSRYKRRGKPFSPLQCYRSCCTNGSSNRVLALPNRAHLLPSNSGHRVALGDTAPGHGDAHYG